jgi:hypothetical protein
MGVDEIVAAIRAGHLSTRDLVCISYALAELGTNATSILGQYGEELVADAYNGKRACSAQKGYDVLTAGGEELQVKAFAVGKRPGVIRTFVYDVVTVEIAPTTGDVESARRYKADDLYTAFSVKWQEKFQYKPFGGRLPQQGDRFERGWTISSAVPFTDVTTCLRRSPNRALVVAEFRHS